MSGGGEGPGPPPGPAPGSAPGPAPGHPPGAERGGQRVRGRVLAAWNSVKYGWTLRPRPHFSPRDPLYLLGRVYAPGNGEELARFRRDFCSRLWFTYRSGFPALPGTPRTTDCGWGCTLRSAQMLLGQGLVLHLLGRVSPTPFQTGRGRRRCWNWNRGGPGGAVTPQAGHGTPRDRHGTPRGSSGTPLDGHGPPRDPPEPSGTRSSGTAPSCPGSPTTPAPRSGSTGSWSWAGSSGRAPGTGSAPPSPRTCCGGPWNPARRPPGSPSTWPRTAPVGAGRPRGGNSGTGSAGTRSTGSLGTRDTGIRNAGGAGAAPRPRPAGTGAVGGREPEPRVRGVCQGAAPAPLLPRHHRRKTAALALLPRLPRRFPALPGPAPLPGQRGHGPGEIPAPVFPLLFSAENALREDGSQLHLRLLCRRDGAGAALGGPGPGAGPPLGSGALSHLHAGRGSRSGPGPGHPPGAAPFPAPPGETPQKTQFRRVRFPLSPPGPPEHWIGPGSCSRGSGGPRAPPPLKLGLLWVTTAPPPPQDPPALGTPHTPIWGPPQIPGVPRIHCQRLLRVGGGLFIAPLRTPPATPPPQIKRT
ncbi:cysteine protease ATG4D isoform X4 [Corvus moneduloides]|uniref:cysteine protease ATG4D isoform X4 n=1 Tax=Corvus moneduloides TaxID=1196302 RepID=UPI001363D7A4|nr:cysteine protease ATG4D isoform X4 [Corvus moneduloides]